MFEPVCICTLYFQESGTSALPLCYTAAMFRLVLSVDNARRYQSNGTRETLVNTRNISGHPLTQASASCNWFGLEMMRVTPDQTLCLPTDVGTCNWPEAKLTGFFAATHFGSGLGKESEHILNNVNHIYRSFS